MLTTVLEWQTFDRVSNQHQEKNQKQAAEFTGCVSNSLQQQTQKQPTSPTWTG